MSFLGEFQEKTSIGYSYTISRLVDSGAMFNDADGNLVGASQGRAVFSTSASYIYTYTEVEPSFYAAFPQYSQINVKVGGVNHIINVSSAYQLSSVYLGPGSKTVEIVNGVQSLLGSGPSDPVYSASIIKVIFDDTATQIYPDKGKTVLIYGDSITVGGNAAIPIVDAWTMLLRDAYAGNVALYAQGYNSLQRDYYRIGISGLVSEFAAYNPVPTSIYLAIGTNDYGLALWSAASFGTQYAALLDALHTQFPSATIFAQTPIVRSTETANGYGSTLGDYRTQIATAQSTRSAWCTLVDGTAIMTTSDLGDGVHPTTAGHALYASYVLPLLP